MNEHRTKPYVVGDEHISEEAWLDMLSRTWKTTYHPFGRRGPDFMCVCNGLPFIVEVEQRKSHWENGKFPWPTANLPYRRWKGSRKIVLPHIYFSTCTDLSRAILVDMPFQWNEPEWKTRCFSNHGRPEQYTEVSYYEFSTNQIPRAKAIDRVKSWWESIADSSGLRWEI